jgi:hypothetical protein
VPRGTVICMVAALTVALAILLFMIFIDRRWLF